MNCRINYIKYKDKKYLPWQYYEKLGYITIPMKGKRPVIPGWNLKTKTVSATDVKDNIGILCGPVNNLTIIDIDSKDNGLEFFMKYLASKNIDNFGFFNTPVLESKSGIHLYFKYEKSLKSTIRLKIYENKVGIDVKNNGVVLTAPSAIDGKVYRWIRGLSMNNVTVKKMPRWLLKDLRAWQGI